MGMLKTNPILEFTRRISTKGFFLIFILYQIIFLFQGVDFADQGYYPPFYREIFSDPASVKYNFMYWFSGIIGGIWYKLFSFLGLLGIRLAGAIVTTFTALLIYNLLKNYLDKSYLKLGLLLLILFINNDPKELYYNNIAAFIYVLTAWSLFTGLRDDKSIKLFFAGALVAVNILTRIPNVLQLGLILIIFYHGFLHHQTFGKQFRQAILFMGGFSLAMLLLILVMKILGHWDVFLEATEFVFRLGKGKSVSSEVKNIDVNGYYNFMTQVQSFYRKLFTSLRYVLYTIVMVVILSTVMPSIKLLLKRVLWLYRLFKIGLILVFSVIVLSGTGILNNLPNLIVLYFFAGFTLLTTLLIVFTSTDNNLKILAVIGSYFSLTYSIGSSSGLWTSGLYSFWISVPIAINHLFTMEAVEINNLWSYTRSGERKSVKFQVSTYQIKIIRNWGLYLCILGCFYSALYFPIQDKADRTALKYTINNKHMIGILTTRERANVINELLSESSKYIKPGDYVFAYDAIPMVHYMTDTKPFMYNSYPWLYQLDVFREQLNLALKDRKKLPVVICQRVSTNGYRGYSWPVSSKEEYERWNGKRNKVLNDFLNSHQYKEVWRNDAFKILIPPGDSVLSVSGF